jgi:cobalt-zinc-cadmium efflux system protein
MADAGHNLSDVLGLALAWGAVLLARKEPSERFTYGLRGSSILAALANAMLLLIASGAIAWEAAQRLLHPPAVAGMTIGIVAAIGIAVNGFSAWLFMRGRHDDLNIRGAYLHMAADAAVSLGVAVSGAAILVTGWYWLDPLISIVIVAVIAAGTWQLLREALQLALSGVPRQIDIASVHAFLRQLAGVTDVHDLHIWGIGTTEAALTAHLVMPDGHPGDDVLDAIAQTLHARFLIGHCTLQVERGTTCHACSLAGQGKVGSAT